MVVTRIARMHRPVAEQLHNDVARAERRSGSARAPSLSNASCACPTGIDQLLDSVLSAATGGNAFPPCIAFHDLGSTRLSPGSRRLASIVLCSTVGPVRPEEIMSSVFGLGPQVRYVAVANGQEVQMQQRRRLSEASASESDRFEELLVNPTLLVLAQQRGDIDCGGLRYVVVRYGHFFQVVVPRPEGGHVSVAVEPSADPTPIAEAVIGLLG